VPAPAALLLLIVKEPEEIVPFGVMPKNSPAEKVFPLIALGGENKTSPVIQTAPVPSLPASSMVP
jgi:hypothetical protein